MNSTIEIHGAVPVI